MSSSEIKWEGNHIEVTPPKRPKKLTATRFATVLGLNPWSSGFTAWCAITRTYEEPFEDTIYTAAGKVIEPKQAQYMKDTYMMDNLITPTDVYGPDYFKKTYGDFFPLEKIFGGSWDYLLRDPSTGKPVAVLEMKTSKRVEDWKDDVPEYYALQAALYAYLLGVDQVYMVASFLEPSDYDHPENFVCSVNNTIVRPFSVSKRYPRFDSLIKMATDWWNTYVTSGISPDFDEKRDADILKALRTVEAEPDVDVSELIKQAEEIQTKLDVLYQQTAPLEKAQKALSNKIKAFLMGSLKPGDKYATAHGSSLTWTLTRSTTNKLDEERLKNDGLYDQYLKPTETYRMTMTKEEK